MQWLAGKKTYIVVALWIAYQFLRWYFEGQAPDWNAIFQATGLAALRAGVAKVPGMMGEGK
jgi:hypothetical protein